MTADEKTQRLLHDLRVHQAQLEMQNDELSRARVALEASRARYFDLFDLAPVGYLSLSETGAILEANLTVSRLLGVPRDALVHQPLTRFVFEGDQDGFYLHQKRFLETQWGQSWELRLRRPDGSWFWTQTDVSAARDAEGHPVCRMVVSDISERKRNESALELQSAALNAAASAIVITERDGQIAWANSAFTTLTGFTAHEGGDPAASLGADTRDQAFFEKLRETARAGEPWHGEISSHRRDGSAYPEDVTITPVETAQGEITHWIAIRRDLTDEKRLQAQLVQAQKLETVGLLAGGIAHDFNNLLTVINTTAELALLDLPESDALFQDLERIRQAGTRAAALTRQLLAFGRRQIMRPELVDLTLLVHRLGTMLARLIREDIHLVLALESDLWSVRADPGQLEQVLLNLAVNARDAMPRGGTLTIAARNLPQGAGAAPRPPDAPAGQFVMLSVHDTGCGMDEAVRARIFEPFFTTKAAQGGSGLGLAMVYGIIEQSGGSITVESEVERGTCFRVYLPRVEAAVREAISAPTRETARATETILVVDDEDAVRHVAKRILGSAGYSVLTAKDARTALEALERHDGTVHLLLTDVVLPGPSGVDLANRVRGVRPGIRVLFTSGHTDDAIFRHGVHDDAVDFLGKPYTTAELTRTVREVLDR